MTTTGKRNGMALGLIGLVVMIMVILAVKAHSAPPDEALPPMSELDYGKTPGLVDESGEKLFGAGRVFLGGAATFRLKDISDTSNIKGAGGFALQGGYHVVDNVAIVGEAATENTGHSVFDSAAAGLQLFIPVGDSGLAPYGKLLGGRQFEGEENWFVAGEVGLEVRGKWVGAFLGVRYQYDLESQSDLMPCIGIFGHFGTQ